MSDKIPDIHCECGQYLTIYLRVIGKLMSMIVTDKRQVMSCGVQCPNKDCTKTYTVTSTKEGANIQNNESVLNIYLN